MATATAPQAQVLARFDASSTLQWLVRNRGEETKHSRWFLPPKHPFWYEGTKLDALYDSVFVHPKVFETPTKVGG